MDYQRAFQTAYLAQQQLAPTPEHIKAYGVDPETLKLLYETDDYWVILTDASRDRGATFVTVVYKAGPAAQVDQTYAAHKAMQSIEI
jgi:hypothetical protein